MRNRTEQILPRAREDSLVVKELHGETLVYDPDSHEAHCLNQTSALIWKNCDGRTTVMETAQLLSRELDVPIEDEVIWLGLQQLEEAHLLQEPVMPRRELVRRIGIAALLLPAIAAMYVPPAYAQGSSCIGRPCNSNLDCCPTAPDCFESPAGCQQ
jgi:Coenzyme PQQ synthesis protein D (PqqD)